MWLFKGIESACTYHHWYDLLLLPLIVNWIFHVSDFLRLYMKSFKYGLILSKYSLIEEIFTFIFNIIVVIKISYSYWFLLIFFLLKKVPDVSNYSVFDCSSYFIFWLFLSTSITVLGHIGLLKLFVMFTHNFVLNSIHCFFTRLRI